MILGFCLFIASIYLDVKLVKAGTIWSDDFNDGDYYDWQEVLGKWSAENKSIYCFGAGTIAHPSNNDVGTWSFDVFISNTPDEDFSIVFVSDELLTQLPPVGLDIEMYFISIYTFDKTEILLRGNYGKYPDTHEVLGNYTAKVDLSGRWHHIDITRDITGLLRVYLDRKIVIEHVDTRINSSSYFQFISEYGPSLDNLVVSDSIDPPENQGWSDNFEDGDYEGWDIYLGNFTSKPFIFAEGDFNTFSIMDKYLQSTAEDVGFAFHSSRVTSGTWSLDVFAAPTNLEHFYVSFITSDWTFLPEDDVPFRNEGYDIGIWTNSDTFVLYKKTVTDETPLVLGTYSARSSISNNWQHIDVTREIDGCIQVFINGSLAIEALDTEIGSSNYFMFISEADPIIDNIYVNHSFISKGYKPKLSVNSDYGTVTGEGYYFKGKTATFSVSPTFISDEPGVQHLFSEWSSISLGGYTGTENPSEIVMNNDITEVAKWKTQYYLTIEEGMGGSVTTKPGWFDAGSKVSIEAIPNSGFVFSTWQGSGSGSYSGPSSRHDIILAGPITQKPVFLDMVEPVAKAGTDRKIKVGEIVFFDSIGSIDNVGIIRYLWDLGDGVTDILPITTHSYGKPGIYTVTLTVTDSAGNSASDTIFVTVEEGVNDSNGLNIGVPTWVLILIGAGIILGLVPILLVKLSK
jgi:hypothetical protein